MGWSCVWIAGDVPGYPSLLDLFYRSLQYPQDFCRFGFAIASGSIHGGLVPAVFGAHFRRDDIDLPLALEQSPFARRQLTVAAENFQASALGQGSAALGAWKHARASMDAAGMAKAMDTFSAEAATLGDDADRSTRKALDAVRRHAAELMAQVKVGDSDGRHADVK